MPPVWPSTAAPRDSAGIPAGEQAPPKRALWVETLEGLTFRAETRVVESDGGPKRLRTRVIITNRSTQGVRIHYGDCSPQLRAYQHAHRSGMPVWYEGRLPSQDPKTKIWTRICDAYGLHSVIEPGDSALAVQRFQMESTIREVLGDSLPEGRYFFTTVFETTRPRFRTPELPSGSAMLTR